MTEKKSRWGRKEKKVETAPILEVRQREFDIPNAVAILPAP